MYYVRRNRVAHWTTTRTTDFLRLGDTYYNPANHFGPLVRATALTSLEAVRWVLAFEGTRGVDLDYDYVYDMVEVP